MPDNSPESSQQPPSTSLPSDVSGDIRFKEILRGVDTVAVQGYTMDGTVIFWNQASARLYGFSEQEALGQNLLDLIIPEPLHAAVRHEIQTMAQSGKPMPAAELQLRRKDGSLVDVYSSHSYVDIPGKPPELFCIDIDITERKRFAENLKQANALLEAESQRANRLTERAEAANRAKSTFLANMSHEIRTPMNGVLGMLQIVLDSDLSADQREQLETVQDCAYNLLNILNDILDFSKVESGKMELQPRVFNLHDFIDDLARPFASRAQQKGLDFQLQRAPNLPDSVFGDPDRIRQVLNNLLSNAVKFTEQGSISLKVHVPPQSIEPRPNRVLFSVQDTGIGIPADKQSLLFERFEQADASHTRKYGGTGIGLAIARQLSDLMDASLRVNSAPDCGACFCFNIELPPASSPIDLPPIDFADAPQLLGHVLIAEDNPVNRAVAVGMLEKLGLQVDAVDDGLKACQSVAAQAYDLIFMDIQMPHLDGIAATQRIRNMERQSSTAYRGKVPILALTAHALPEDRAACDQVGMNGFITKPVTFTTLAAHAAKWLPKRHP